MKALLLVLKGLRLGAFVAFWACWATPWLVGSWPKWVIPGFFVSLGVFFVSAVLREPLEIRFVHPTEAAPIEAAHPRLETTLERLGFVFRVYFYFWPAFVVVSFSLLHAENTLHLRSVIAAPLGLIIGSAAFWLLMLAYAKGWLDDDDSGIA